MGQLLRFTLHVEIAHKHITKLQTTHTRVAVRPRPAGSVQKTARCRLGKWSNEGEESPNVSTSIVSVHVGSELTVVLGAREWVSLTSGASSR